jgi:hypothetical protein
MSDDSTTVTLAKKDSAAKPVFWKIQTTHPNLHYRTVFRSVSEQRARQWLANHCPRGSELHLVGPDGTTHSYEHERAGENGTDAERWDPNFDRDTWTPTDQAEPPGDSIWADKEG